MPDNDGKKWIFDHWNYIDADSDDWKEIIEEEYECPVEDISDADKWDFLARMEELDYEDAKENLQSLIGDDKVLCVGYADLWTGKAPGGFIAEDLQDAIDHMRGRDSGDIGFYQDEDDELHMTFAHHDGTNDAVLRKITSEGAEVIYDNEYDYDNYMDDQELHKYLMETDGLTESISFLS